MSILGRTQLGRGCVVLEVDHDPTSVATDAPAGSLIIDSGGLLYRKTVSGANAKVQSLIGVKRGTYVGDGATSRGITGVGFKPTRVVIYVKKTTDNDPIVFFETDIEINSWHVDGGSITSKAVGNHQFDSNKILSLDADGFTIGDNGADQKPNTLNEDYAWVAYG